MIGGVLLMTASPQRTPATRNPWRKMIGWTVLGILALGVVIRVATIEPRRVKAYLQDEKPVILAHQGAAGHAPSNTLEAFELGLKQGGDIIELDVHMTKDGVVVVSHDETIDRLTNGKGLIREMTLAELRAYDFGYGFTPDGGKTYPYRGKGVRIPTLEEVFQRFPGVRVNVELKQQSPPTEEKVLELVRKYHMEDKVLIGSFHTGNVDRWRQLAGERTAFSAATGHMYEFAAFWLLRLDWLYKPKVDAFQLPVSRKLGPVTIRFDTPRLINSAHRHGIKVHYWTINDEETARRLIQLGADGIITDYPDRVHKVLKELGYR